MKLPSTKRFLKHFWQSQTARVMFLTFVGLLIAWISDILLAAILGTSQTTDALVIAVTLPRLVDTVAREGTRQSLVPLFIERQDTDKRSKYYQFISGIVNLALIIGVSLTVVVELLAPLILELIAPGLSVEGMSEAVLYLRLAAPTILFAPAIAILSVVLNSKKRFVVVAFRNALSPTFVIVAIILAQHWHKSVAPLTAFAYAISSAIFFILVFFDARTIGYRHNWKIWISKKDLVTLSMAGYWPTFGFAVRQIALMIKTLLLPSLAAVGGVSTVYFAQRIAFAIQTLVGVSIATTSLPALTEYELAGNQSKLSSILWRSLLRSLIITAPFAVGISLFSKDIITIVYSRGSFESASIAQTSQIFIWLGLSTVLISLIPIFEAVLYAKKAYKQVVLVMIGMAIFEVFLCWFLWQWYSLIGIAASFLLSAITYTVVILVLSIKQLSHE